jgi:hypothetical protein
MNKQLASEHARTSNTTELFDARNTFQAELERRAWMILAAFGYKVYKQDKMEVSMYKRGSVDIVMIKAEFEENFQPRDVHYDLPMVQFEDLLRRDHAAS